MLLTSDSCRSVNLWLTVWRTTFYIEFRKDGIHRLAVNRLDRGKFFRVKDGVEIYGLKM